MTNLIIVLLKNNIVWIDLKLFLNVMNFIVEFYGNYNKIRDPI